VYPTQGEVEKCSCHRERSPIETAHMHAHKVREAGNLMVKERGGLDGGDKGASTRHGANTTPGR